MFDTNVIALLFIWNKMGNIPKQIASNDVTIKITAARSLMETLNRIEVAEMGDGALDDGAFLLKRVTFVCK